jgi:hypothetical protein
MPQSKGILLSQKHKVGTGNKQSQHLPRKMTEKSNIPECRSSKKKQHNFNNDPEDHININLALSQSVAVLPIETVSTPSFNPPLS